MPTGHVKVFHADRSFGFITVDDGSEAYVAGDEVAATSCIPATRSSSSSVRARGAGGPPRA
jgi:hypothetical protein